MKILVAVGESLFITLSSIKSILLTTPIVLSPSGSTDLAIYRESEFAISVFAAVSAKMRAFGGEIYFKVHFLI